LFLCKKFKEIVNRLNLKGVSFCYGCSSENSAFDSNPDFSPINVTTECEGIISNFDLVLSLHSKQVFPQKLIDNVRCVNIHPGYNPFNRGWFPQVFSILNGKPLGVTIHVMDERIDHGPIIEQETVPVYVWDTSLTAYNRVLDKEIELIEKNLVRIIQGAYEAKPMTYEGNINLKTDFDSLCELDLKEETSVGYLIDRLRALTHGDYKNCYFRDENGNRVYVSIDLKPE
jgi:methionyl-tRNA formyltransferase